MAGKSTFLRAVATAILLAHCGCAVPAAAMEFCPVATIFSSVQIVDNISAGESFYLAEVRRIHALAVALRDNGSAIAVVDEPFRGTNVHDAAVSEDEVHFDYQLRPGVSTQRLGMTLLKQERVLELLEPRVYEVAAPDVTENVGRPCDHDSIRTRPADP